MAGSPLFNIFGGGSYLPPNVQNMLTMFQQFRNSFRGDPRQQVQDLLNSGRVSQEQYNQAVLMANELSKIIR